MTATNTLSILHPGVLSTIQDFGRFGFASMGLTEGGPVDKQSAIWANRLCGNVDNTPLIELTLGGLSFECTQDCSIAITGANVALTIDDNPVPMWTTLTLQKKQVVKIGHARCGIRSYIAMAGGLQLKKQFGSVATVVREAIGGLNGKPLQSGDEMPCHSMITPKQMLAYAYRPKFDQDVCLRLLVGCQHRLFSRDDKRAFFAAEYQLSPQCDRMGFRLTSKQSVTEIALLDKTLLSEGISLGAVQIPPDGQPIVMMNDHQTIGGYPKLGAVLSIDLHKLAQCTPGAKVRFVPISSHRARQLLIAQQQRLRITPLFPVG